MIFADRSDAGRVLASRLKDYEGRADGIVLALPRGGIPVAYEIAKQLELAMDVFIVRKLGVPGHEELAMGAIASGNTRVINYDVVQGLGIDQGTIDAVTNKELKELHRREQLYRGERQPLELSGRTVILVDDGIATGSTARAAIAAIRQLNPKRLVVAVPVATSETCGQIGAEVDEIVCVETPHGFMSVSQWYEDFGQTTDEEVRELLMRAA